MAKLNLKTMKKSTKDHIITFAMVIVVYIIVQTMITTGNMSSLMQGLLVRYSGASSPWRLSCDRNACFW